MKEITAQALKQRLLKSPRPFLLDVRQPDEFAAGHIDGAILIPLGELEQRLGELDQHREIVVNCKGGGRSAKAVQFLESRGFVDVANLVGGYIGWKEV